VTGNCASCHNGVTATGKGSGHFLTTRECNVCHEITYWSPDIFRHLSAGYPGDHRRALTCTDCHGGNSEAVTWSAPAYQPDCAGCHASNYRSDPHTKYGNVKYTVSELRDCSGSCHIYTDATLTQIRTRRSSQHRVSDGSFN